VSEQASKCEIEKKKRKDYRREKILEERKRLKFNPQKGIFNYTSGSFLAKFLIFSI
jgi:hypothetical protein